MVLIPLFPLSTVLYPNTLLPLFIFEKRYRIMVERCISSNSSFGIALIKRGMEVGGPAEPYSIGTEARIVAKQRLRGGCYNVVVKGEKKFEIIWIDYSEPYLQAEIKWVDEKIEEGEEEKRLKSVVQSLFRKYLALLEKLGVCPLNEGVHELDPTNYSYVVADVLQLDPREKQRLLEANSTSERLKMEIEYLVTLLDESI
ncbi:hypothetical protein B9Q02_05940 [Candidatus Marsarchaeota G1 archaeon BE_D]|jgi:Lon protease-like protein|uniref:Lon N-terminal domain-containing protein n=1 Tax=Candidatus Marsarchaeota G1 archaeon BE_D TaxID=1978156 RepID=A0A2R6AGN1_9ARCH|nr:MAG: hypothetical protein B9Q02_05940 [Candidatus Marsarchaeota G1 archaeon BE_D]